MPNELNSNNTLPRLRKDATATAASFSGALPGVYRGVVVSRDDPDKQGRIKVSLPHIFGDVTVDELPWVYPITSAWNISGGEATGTASGSGGGSSTGTSGASVKPLANGSSTGSGSGSGSSGSGQQNTGGLVNVPPMSAPVVCMFEGGDHRYPMYIGGSFGKPGFTDTVPQHSFAANGNSPDNYSFTSPGGTTIQCDDRPGTEKVITYLPTGDYVSVSKAGLLEVNAKQTVSIKAANLVSIQCDTQIQAKGTQILIYADGGDVVVEGGKTVNVNGGNTVNIQGGKINLNCGSSQSAVTKLKTVDTTPVFDGK